MKQVEAVMNLPLNQQGQYGDQEFWEKLKGDTGGETCKRPGCGQLVLKQSSMCKAHHFEMVMGHPYADPQSSF